MKYILTLISCVLGLSLNYGQVYAQDDSSGGRYTISVDPKIEEIIRTSAKAKCNESQSPKNTETFNPCEQSQKIMGYKIQLIYTKDRNTAKKTKIGFSQKFPDLDSELVYTQPDYRVLTGDYFSKRSGSQDLSIIKRQYPGAFLVPWRVWCRKAK